MFYSCQPLGLVVPRGRNRTTDTRIFSPRLFFQINALAHPTVEKRQIEFNGLVVFWKKLQTADAPKTTPRASTPQICAAAWHPDDHSTVRDTLEATLA